MSSAPYNNKSSINLPLFHSQSDKDINNENIPHNNNETNFNDNNHNHIGNNNNNNAEEYITTTTNNVEDYIQATNSNPSKVYQEVQQVQQDHLFQHQPQQQVQQEQLLQLQQPQQLQQQQQQQQQQHQQQEQQELLIHQTSYPHLQSYDNSNDEREWDAGATIAYMDNLYGTEFGAWIKDKENLCLTVCNLRRLCKEYNVEQIARAIKWISEDWERFYSSKLLCGLCDSLNPVQQGQLINLVTADWPLYPDTLNVLAAIVKDSNPSNCALFLATVCEEWSHVVVANTVLFLAREFNWENSYVDNFLIEMRKLEKRYAAGDAHKQHLYNVIFTTQELLTEQYNKSQQNPSQKQQQQQQQQQEQQQQQQQQQQQSSQLQQDQNHQHGLSSHEIPYNYN